MHRRIRREAFGPTRTSLSGVCEAKSHDKCVTAPDIYSLRGLFTAPDG